MVFGFLKAGIIGYYFPSSVIKGMLTGIGIIIILKQIPHFFGYNSSQEVDFAFFQVDGDTTFSGILNAINAISCRTYYYSYYCPSDFATVEYCSFK